MDNATSRLRSVLFRGANILVSVLLILLVAALFYKDYAAFSAGDLAGLCLYVAILH